MTFFVLESQKPAAGLNVSFAGRLDLHHLIFDSSVFWRPVSLGNVNEWKLFQLCCRWQKNSKRHFDPKDHVRNQHNTGDRGVWRWTSQTTPTCTRSCFSLLVAWQPDITAPLPVIDQQHCRACLPIIPSSLKASGHHCVWWGICAPVPPHTHAVMDLIAQVMGEVRQWPWQPHRHFRALVRWNNEPLKSYGVWINRVNKWTLMI